MSQPLLSVNGLMMRFGGLLAVNNVNLELYPQEIVSLIGPNGAGKTTVFNCLTGFYKPTGGTILLRDQHLEGLPGQQIARMGVVRTFQHVRLFREMTVIENLLVAQHQQLKTGLFSGLLKTPSFRRAQSEALDRAATWLERIGLLEHANRQASNLAYGDQRRLEIARCMVTQPEILMLDEPAAGLNPKETKELDELKAREARSKLDGLFENAKEVQGVKLFTVYLTGTPTEAVRAMCDAARDRAACSVAAIIAENEGKYSLAVAVGKEAQAKGLAAGRLAKEIASVAGGNGGGKPDFAMAGIRDASKIDDALNAVPGIVEKVLNA